MDGFAWEDVAQDLPLTRLWHVSDRHDINCFDPRPPPNPRPGDPSAVVWAVDTAHLPHYLLPRDCPRVCARPRVGTSQTSPVGLLGDRVRGVVIWIESDWVQRVETLPLWVYRLPAEGFSCVDVNAGYHTSVEAVRPLRVHSVASPGAALRRLGVELRAVDRLRAVADAVAQSDLAFSIIRLRNAAPT